MEYVNVKLVNTGQQYPQFNLKFAAVWAYGLQQVEASAPKRVAVHFKLQKCKILSFSR